MAHWSEEDLRYLKGVGPKIAQKLQRLGLQTQRDLLFHLPLRYEDRTFVTPIGSLQPGQRGQIEAEVLHSAVSFRRGGRSRRVLVAKLGDNTGVVTVRLFYFSGNQQKQFEKGNRLRCYGEVRTAQGELELVHPETEVIDVDDPPPLPRTLTPIYPTTEGLHQLSIKRILAQALDKLVDNAVTLSGEDDHVRVRVEREPDETRLIVENSGTRLPDSLTERLFDSLVSLRDVPGEAPHLGLGLYIVRLVAEAHGGQARASNNSTGVEFTIALPVTA